MPPPPTGLSREAIRAALVAYRQRDGRWRVGRIFAGVFFQSACTGHEFAVV